MKKILHIAAALLFVAVSIQAQKIDARLTRLLPSENQQMSLDGAPRAQSIDTAAVKKHINVSFNEDGTVKSFSSITMLKEGADCPTAKLEALGVGIKLQIGRMLLLNIPAQSLEAVGKLDEIESVNADGANRLTNNNARVKSNVSEVATQEKAAAHNLPQAYTGKGVVVGIIDQGIDFNHAAFRNADGTSRVKVGIVYDGEDPVAEATTADAIAALTTDNRGESHGTHVAGTAAGSIVKGLDGTAIDKQGVAPEADLVLCGLGENGLYDESIITCIMAIFEYAKEQNKPCVINVSIGSVTQFHDGESNILLAIREYYKKYGSKGRLCVFCSSNSANRQCAILTTLPAAGTDGYNLRTILGESETVVYNGQTVNKYDGLTNFFYNTDGSEIDVDAKVVDVKTGTVYTLEQKPLYSVTNPNTTITSLVSSKTKTIYPVNNKHYVQYNKDGKYCFHEPNLRLAYFVKGDEGKTFRAMEAREDDPAGFYSYGLSGYTSGVDNGAFSAHICGEEVIGVGAYVSAAGWLSIDGTEQSYMGTWNTENGICAFSSWGTDDNGGNHPDVLAPGSPILSSYNIYDKSFFDADQKVLEEQIPYITDITDIHGRNSFYGVMQGTSMSTPHVTGIIALWLQANPELSYADVRELIKETSYNDEFTTNVEKIPSHDIRQAGAGKIDALKGLQKIKGVTGIQMVSADGERQATPATMYSVDDNCYNTLGQRVSKNAKGLVIYKGKVYLNR